MSATTPALPPLTWSHETTDIPEAGLPRQRRASPAELAALTRALELVACDSLVADYRLRPIAGGGYRLTGSLTAAVRQACIVSLEPIDATVTAPFDVEYWPPGRTTDEPEGEIDALSAVEIEPLLNGHLDVGRIVFEQLAASLDPYPRKEGAEFTPPEDKTGDAGASSPFAALARLKAPKP